MDLWKLSPKAAAGLESLKIRLQLSCFCSCVQVGAPAGERMALIALGDTCMVEVEEVGYGSRDQQQRDNKKRLVTSQAHLFTNNEHKDVVVSAVFY